MYSYEDRVRAVELYIKLGKRARATIRQLGFPTKNALKGWCREFEQRLNLPLGYAGRRHKYLQAQKEAAVEHYLTHDRCIAATMRAPGRWTLTAWVREALPESHSWQVWASRCYGYRRLQASLGRQCVTISEKVVQRLMKQESLVVSKPKRRRYGSYLGEISPATENVINRPSRQRPRRRSGSLTSPSSRSQPAR